MTLGRERTDVGYAFNTLSTVFQLDGRRQLGHSAIDPHEAMSHSGRRALDGLSQAPLGFPGPGTRCALSRWWNQRSWSREGGHVHD